MSSQLIKQRQILFRLHHVALNFTCFVDASELSIFVFLVQLLDLSLEIINAFF